MLTYIIIALSVLVAVGRIFITPRLMVPTAEGVYEAVAHMLVGFLIGMRFADPNGYFSYSKLYWRIGWGLAFWELGWFAVQKIGF